MQNTMAHNDIAPRSDAGPWFALYVGVLRYGLPVWLCRETDELERAEQGAVQLYPCLEPWLKRAFGKLTPRQRQALANAYRLPGKPYLNNTCLAALYGITSGRISGYAKEGRRKLCNALSRHAAKHAALLSPVADLLSYRHLVWCRLYVTRKPLRVGPRT